MIIGLSGYAKSGKDTVAEIIQDLTKEAAPGLHFVNTWEVKKFAGKLKLIASILTGIPEKDFEDQDFKNTELDSEWGFDDLNLGIEYPMTVREFLQKLGTDAIRDGLHKNAWVNALMADYKPRKMDQYKPSNWIITDCRFPNEAEAIKERGGVIIRIDRPGINPVNAHPSETALDNWDFDYKIANVSDLVALRQSVEVLLNKISWRTI
jgi:hypothetical protein